MEKIRENIEIYKQIQLNNGDDQEILFDILDCHKNSKYLSLRKSFEIFFHSNGVINWTV